MLAVILSLSIVLAGCGKDKDKAANTPAASTSSAAFDAAQYPIGLVHVLKSNPVVQIMMAGFTTKMKELGYTSESFTGETADAQEEIKFGESALAKKMKGMFIYLIDPSVYPLIKKAADQGVPVVSAHTPVAKPEDVPGLKAWASSDPLVYGATAAKGIAEKIGKKGIVAITQGSFNSTENSAAKGFMDEMAKNYPDIKVIAPIEEGYDPAQASAKAVAVIQANKGLSAAFSTTGGGPATWSIAAEQANVKDLVIIGMDYSRQNLDLIKSGKVYGIIAQPLFEEHAKAAELLDKILKGQEVPFANIIEAPLVTADKLDKYYAILADVDKAFGR
ncbi:unnamed protein product [Aphanomyces euteiches]